MKRIVALILSILMSVLSSLGIIVPPADGVTEGDWLAIVVEEFGIAKQDVEIPYADVAEKYLDVVKTAYGYGIIDAADDLDVDAFATNKFVVDTIKAASSVDVSPALPYNSRKAKLADAVKALAAAVTASNNQKIAEVPESVVVPQADVADLSAVEFTVVGGKFVFAAKDFALKAGDKFIADAAYVVKAVEYADDIAIVDAEKIAIEEAVETIDFEGTVEANLDEATAYDQNGNLIENDLDPVVAGQGFIKDKAGELIDKAKEEVVDFLKNPKISFSIKGFKVKAAYSGGRVDISVGGKVADGVKVEKAYSLSNIKFDTKYDANLAKLQIKEAYLKMNYDLVETTELQGSYAASVVPEGGSFITEGESFLDKVKANLGNLDLKKGGGIKVNIFTFDIPIAETGLTVEMNVSLTLSASGKVEIIVTSNETKGYEIINNKGRVIHASTVYDRMYNISGDFRAVLGLDLSLTFLKYKIVDVAFNGGIGAYVTTDIFNVKTNGKTTAEIPMDVIVEINSGLAEFEDLRFCADVELYGILSISVGEESIISKIGLSKTWSFYDRGNGTFAHLHIENSGIVDQCSYAAA